jgi:ATP-dependent Clp protease ATP-binding subunit ClpX
LFQSLGFGNLDDKSLKIDNEDRKLSDIEELNRKYDQLLGEVETTDVVKFGLIPEFVGRFHIVVPLHSLSEDHLMKILTETKNSLIAQKEFLLAYDEVKIFLIQTHLKVSFLKDDRYQERKRNCVH